jgi:hypothetical protein
MTLLVNRFDTSITQILSLRPDSASKPRFPYTYVPLLGFGFVEANSSSFRTCSFGCRGPYGFLAVFSKPLLRLLFGLSWVRD